MPETPLRTDRNGLVAGFVVAIENGTITTIGFKASTCVTLVAYCELIAELIEGQHVAAAAALSPALLVANLSGVPALKRDRAMLAVDSFRAALAAAHGNQTGNRHAVAG
jgi:NifU-like protein involved in Fe-S cluster formation